MTGIFITDNALVNAKRALAHYHASPTTIIVSNGTGSYAVLLREESYNQHWQQVSPSNVDAFITQAEMSRSRGSDYA